METQLPDRLSALEQENAMLRSRLQACEQSHALLQAEVAEYRRREQDRQAQTEPEPIGELTTLSDSLEHRLLEATAIAANTLLAIEDFDQSVNTALKILGESLETDRINVIEFLDHSSDPLPHWRMLYEWHSPNTPSQIAHPELAQGTHQGLEEAYQQLIQGQGFSYLLDEMPEPFRSGQAALGVKALHVVPIFVEDKLWGIVGFDDCCEAKRRSPAELAVLQIAANCLGSAIQRERTQQALLQTEQLRSQELEHLNTELQQTLDLLSESEQRYRQLMELASEGIFRVEYAESIPVDLPVEEQVKQIYQHLRIAEHNLAYAQMFGYDTSDAMLNTRLSDLHIADAPENAVQMEHFVRNGHQMRNQETVEFDRFGHKRHFFNNGFSIIRDGYAIGGWGTQIDITELRETQQALLQAEQARVAELAEANEALQRSYRLLETTAIAANTLLTTDDFDVAVNTALQILGEALDTDRVGIAENFNSPSDSPFPCWRMTAYEWNSPGAVSQFLDKDTTQGSYEEIQWLYELFQRGQTASYVIEESPEPFRSAQIAIGVKSTILVPIFVEGQWWGVLGLDDCRETKWRSASELAALQIAANCLGSAIQRERTQQALLQAEQAQVAELAKANEALKRSLDALATDPDLDRFLIHVLREITQQVDLSKAYLFMYNAVSNTLTTHVRFVEGQVYFGSVPGDPPLFSQPFDADLSPAWQYSISHRKFIFQPVGAEDDRTWDETKAWHIAQGHSAHGGIALVAGDQPVGFLGVAWQGKTLLTEEQAELIEALANQATLAIQVTRLAEEAKQAAIAREQEKAAQERAAELAKANEALKQTVDVLATETDLDRFLGHVLQVIATQLDAPLAEYWYHPEPDNVAYVGLTYWQGQILRPEEQPGHVGLSGYPVPPEMIHQESLHHRRDHFITENIATSVPHIKIANEYGLDAGAWYESHGVHHLLNVPLILGDKTIGALIVFLPSDRHFTEQQIELTYALAQQVTLAIQLTRLADEAKQAAIAREQEIAAQERAAELAKANEALKRSLDSLAAEPSLDKFLGQVLGAISDQFDSPLAEYWYHVEDTAYISMMSWQGQIYNREDIAQHYPGNPGVAGFKVPLEMICGETLQTRKQYFIIEDFLTNSFTSQVTWYPENGLYKEINVPMILGDECIGALIVRMPREYQITTQQIELAQALAHQATLAVQLTQLAEEAKQAAIAREQEKAAQERAAELEKANETLQQRDRLLSTIAEIMKDLLENPQVDEAIALALQRIGEAAGISRIALMQEKTEAETGRLQHCIVHEWTIPGVQRQIEDPRSNTVYNDDYGTLPDELHAGQSIWYVLEDLPEPARTQQGGLAVKSTGAAPIFIEGRYFGCVGFDDCVNYRQWTTYEIDVLISGAGAIGAALYRQQLVDRLVAERIQAEQERAAELEKANESLQCSLNQLASDRNLESFLGRILQESIRVLQGAEAQIFLYHPDSHTLSPHLGVNQQGQVFAEPGIIPEYLPFSQPVPADLTPAWSRMVTHHQPIHFSLDDPDHWPGAVEWHRNHGYRGSVCTAMLLGDEPIGFLGMAIRDRAEFSESELAFFQALAQQATLAIQLTRLAEEAKHAAILDERNRMASEIHDTLAQAFTGISIQLEVAKPLIHRDPQEAQQILDHLSQLAETGLTEARRSVWALYPPAAEYADLAQLLYDSVEQMTRNTDMVIEVNLQGTPCPLPPFIGMNLLRIGQEALTNALKHAQAQTITIELTYECDRVFLTIRDNGRGFIPPDTIDNLNGGFGLMGMYERCDRINAQLSLTSQPGQGTQILVEVPHERP